MIIVEHMFTTEEHSWWVFAAWITFREYMHNHSNYHVKAVKVGYHILHKKYNSEFWSVNRWKSLISKQYRYHIFLWSFHNFIKWDATVKIQTDKLRGFEIIFAPFTVKYSRTPRTPIISDAHSEFFQIAFPAAIFFHCVADHSNFSSGGFDFVASGMKR